MSDAFYSFVVAAGRFPFWVSSRPIVLHAERIPRAGGFILASNHTSPYDVPLLMRHTPRRLDFVSITEIFARPWVGWFFAHMNAFPLERSRSDPKTVRIILDRLARGRVVAMFPEGRIRAENESVVHGGSFNPRVAGIARRAGVPIVPAVVWRSDRYRRFGSWLPLKRTRYGVAFGSAIEVREEAGAETEAKTEAEAERKLAQAYRELYAELTQVLEKSQSA
jgi:1-acyl-sn-glycerol-3-phosphate acyltransferase